MKKLINSKDNVVDDMIEGLTFVFPHIKKISGQNVLVRADCKEESAQTKVSLISGGGSGHEPAHAGFIGKGMLSAAVLGNVFSSPSVVQVINSIKAVNGPKGTLLIVKNYTGDKLNFGVAIYSLVGDDCALLDGKNTEENIRQHENRRGIAGTIFLHKIIGAAAEKNYSLEDLEVLAIRVSKAIVSMGIALSSCTIPAVGKPNFELPLDEVELGLGIHGEPGQKRTKLLSAAEHIKQIMNQILNTAPLSSGKQRVALLVNNLGTTTTMELSIVAKHALKELEEKGYLVERVYMGTFMTALEMAGVSLSVMPVDDLLIELLDFPTEAPAWAHVSNRKPDLKNVDFQIDNEKIVPKVEQEVVTESHHVDAARMEKIIIGICNSLIESADLLTDLDRKVGDGDMGENLKIVSRAILDDISNKKYSMNIPFKALYYLALTVQEKLGGTSGPLYTVFILQVSENIKKLDAKNFISWVKALQAGAEAISKLGGAKEGDRTLLDALIPAIKAMENLQKDSTIQSALKLAVKAAEEGANKTSTMYPKKGRSSYLQERALGVCDPGAKAVEIIFKAVASLFE